MCGYDFLILDGEHGLFGERDYLHTLHALAAADALTFVRMANRDGQAAGRYLDLGADAIVVPNVSTAEQARAMALAMEYPPAGTRGFGASLHRATRYGMQIAEHLQAPRARAALLVIIESALGATNANDILAVEGIDGVIIGPGDLSADLGCVGDYAQPAFAKAVERIEQAALSREKLLGTAPHPGSPVEALAARGHRLLIAAADISLLREAMTSQLEKIRSSL
jgi:2-keto-3-deoxy-L-rhamnonate aldolase RhmA